MRCVYDVPENDADALVIQSSGFLQGNWPVLALLGTWGNLGWGNLGTDGTFPGVWSEIGLRPVCPVYSRRNTNFL